MVHLQQFARWGTSYSCFYSANIKELANSGEILDIGGKREIIIAVALSFEFVQVGLNIN